MLSKNAWRMRLRSGFFKGRRTCVNMVERGGLEFKNENMDSNEWTLEAKRPFQPADG